MSVSEAEEFSGEVDYHREVAAKNGDQQRLVPAQEDNHGEMIQHREENQMHVAARENIEVISEYNITGNPCLGDQIHHHYVPQQNITHQHGPQSVTHYHAPQTVIRLEQHIYPQAIYNASSQKLFVSQQQPVLSSTFNSQVIPSANQPDLGYANGIAEKAVATISSLLPTHTSNKQAATIARTANELKISLKQQYAKILIDLNDSTSVPLLLSGYDGHEKEEFGRKVFINAVSSNTKVAQVFTNELHREPSHTSEERSSETNVIPGCFNIPGQLFDDRKTSDEKHCFELADQHGFLFSKSPGFYKVKSLFTMSEQNATAHFDRKPITTVAKEALIQKEGNKVGAVGPAGTGKTTFAKQMVQDIFEDNPDQLPFVFYIPFKSIDFDEKLDVFQFLVRPTLSDWDHSPETDKALLKEINKSDDVYIVTEALDETDINLFTKTAPSMSLYQSATPDVIMKNLFSGRLLPKSKKLITSRSGAFHDLHPDYKPKFVVNVLGLSEESTKSLCQQLCFDSKEYEQVQLKLNTNPSIQVLCYSPMYCKMIVRYLLQNIGELDKVISTTEVFASALDNCIGSEHFKGEPEMLHQLTALALRGMKENKFIFLPNDLATYDTKCFETFLKMKISGKRDLGVKIFDGDKRFFFAHLLWQEFCSAFCLMFITPVDEFNGLFPHLKEDRWDSVVKFLFGFLNHLVYEKLSATLLRWSESEVVQKKKKLMTLIPSSMPDDCSLTSLLKVCSWALESNDPSIISRVTSSLPSTVTLRGNIHPVDISYFAYILRVVQSNPRVIHIDIGDPTFHGNALKILLEAVNSSPHKVTNVSLTNSKVDDYAANGISQQINNIKKIKLVHCNLASDVIKILSDAINLQLKPLEVLDLSYNNIDSLGLKYLSQCVGKVQKLYLCECDISGNDMERLTVKISQRHQPLELLNLKGNNLGSLGLKHLSKCVGKVRKLHLSQCYLSGADMEELTINISQIDQPLQELILNSNNLGSLGSKNLSQCVGKVESLHLGGCNISGADMEELTTMISKREQPIEKLNLNRNNLGSLGLKYLSQCVGKVQKLILGASGICGVDIDELVVKISQRDQPLELLDLKGNDLSSLGLRHLSTYVGKVNKLDISSCYISGADIEELAIKIAQRDQPLQELTLNCNKLGSLGLKHLSPCVGKVKKLNLRLCDISGADMEELAIKISQQEQPIEELNLSGNNLGSLGLKYLSQCVGKVQKLILGASGVCGTDIDELVVKISQRDQPMELLDLSLNSINDEGAMVLCKSLNKVKCLRMAGNQITENGKHAIRSVLARNDVNCDVEGV